jgi:hypothetical protein
MLIEPSESARAAALARGLTTLLCCGWGYSFAYSFFRCMLDGSGVIVCLAAALPLAAVWAALERKRWGRLSLIVLSILAQALFVVMLSILLYSNHVRPEPADHHLSGCLHDAIHLFSETPDTTVAVLVLSFVTFVWFCMPWVRTEYVHQKKNYLSPGQRVIALSVVTLWGLTMIASPTPPETNAPNTPLKTPRRLTMRY